MSEVVKPLMRASGETWVDKLDWGDTFAVSFSCTLPMYELILDHKEEIRSSRSDSIRDLIKWGLIYLSIRRQEKKDAVASRPQEPEPEKPKPEPKKAKPKTSSKKVKSK